MVLPLATTSEICRVSAMSSSLREPVAEVSDCVERNGYVASTGGASTRLIAGSVPTDEPGAGQPVGALVGGAGTGLTGVVNVPPLTGWTGGGTTSGRAPGRTAAAVAPYKTSAVNACMPILSAGC